MRIAESVVESIRERVDLAELVREYVPGLRRAGRELKGCCPFHQERTPSFYVNPEKQFFHCHGCKKGGTAFTFLMEIEHLTYPEAIAKLGERVGIKVAPDEDQLEPREREALRLREALAFAREFYAKVLVTAPEAAEARRYLDKRGLTPEIRASYGIGFALGDGHSFIHTAERKGYAVDLLSKAGLAGSREGSGRHYDFFRNRILFAITSVKGETIGFGARAMGDAQPKYLNSPDTLVFSKSRVLYGLHEGLAQTRKIRQVLLLEGYMDVLAAHQFGAKNACAPLGTAVTPDHAALLKRYADSVVFVFDPDTAGASAALRGAELLLEQGLSVRIATVPDGLDPDELLHRDGRGAFDAVLAKAQDLPDFQTGRVLARFKGPMSPEDKAKAAREVLETIGKASDEVLKAEWSRRLAERLGADLEALMAQLRRGPQAPAYRGRVAPRASERPQLPPADATLLRAVLSSPALADGERVKPDDLATEAARRILETARVHGARGTVAVIEALGPEDAATARALVVETMVGEPAEVLDAKVSELRLVRRYRALHERYVQMASGELPKDDDLIGEHARLRKALSDRRLLNLI